MVKGKIMSDVVDLDLVESEINFANELLQQQEVSEPSRGGGDGREVSEELKDLPCLVESNPDLPEVSIQERLRNSDVVSRVLQATHKVQIPATIEGEIKEYVSVKLNEINLAESELNVLADKLTRTQAYRDRIVSIHVTLLSLSNRLNQLYSIAESHLLFLPEIAELKSEHLREMMVSGIVSALYDKKKLVETQLKMVESVLWNLNKSFDTVNAVIKIAELSRQVQ